MEVYNNFSFRALYALIVDFFDGPSGQSARRRSQNLLKWWSTYVLSPPSSLSHYIWLIDSSVNRQIFPHHHGASTNSRKSRNKLVAQRAAREESLPL